MKELPKKLLRIKELAFVLPDDFHGTIGDALAEFAQYRKDHADHATYVDAHGLFSPFEVLMMASEDVRVCGEAAIYTLAEEGNYVLAASTHDGEQDVIK